MANKKFSIFGDSISTLEGYTPKDWRIFYEGAEADKTGVHTYEDTWWGQVIDHFDGELLANAAYSGSLVEGDGFPAGTAPERIAALAKGLESPDVILIFIGINDYGWGSAAAGVLGASPAAPVRSARLLGNDVFGRTWTPAELPSAEESQAAREAFECAAAATPQVRLTRFAQAYETMLALMRKAYPKAEIWCCPLLPGRLTGVPYSTHTYNLRGIPFADYNNAIRNAAEKTGAQVADIGALGQDYDAFDGTHPTKLGMRQISAMVIAAMEGKPYPQDPAWRSTNPCVFVEDDAVLEGAFGVGNFDADREGIRANPEGAPDLACAVMEPKPEDNFVADPAVADALPVTLDCCETCQLANITVQRWSCVCNASIKPL